MEWSMVVWKAEIIKEQNLGVIAILIITKVLHVCVKIEQIVQFKY